MQVILPLTDVLCVYGLPEPELHLELKQWLEESEERFVIVLEDDEKAFETQSSTYLSPWATCTKELLCFPRLEGVFHLPPGSWLSANSTWIFHENVHRTFSPSAKRRKSSLGNLVSLPFANAPGGNRSKIGFSGHERMRLCDANDEDSLKKVAWDLVFLQFDYLKTPGSSTKDRAKMETVFAKMAFFQEGIHLVASDFQNRGMNLLQNFLGNGALFSEARNGKALFGSFSKIPAIICGAGPSLEKEVPYLRMLKDRALLFAGGTALSSLSQYCVRPHFGGLIDPHTPTMRYFQHQAHQVPLFFQSRAHPTLMQQMQGPLLWIPGSLNDLLEEESFDGGWNVSTFLTALACHLGCNPIILVGVDLAQSEEKSYAGDLERPEKGELIALKNGLYTRRDWLFAANWLSDFAKEHPEVEWINASQGMEIQGFENRALHELSFEKQVDLFGAVHSAVQEIEKGVLKEFDAEALRTSFNKVGALCNQMLALLESLFPYSFEGSGEYALLELEIEKEIAYVRFLRPIWEVWKPVFARQIPQDVPSIYGIGLNQWLFMKGICDDARKI